MPARLTIHAQDLPHSSDTVSAELGLSQTLKAWCRGSGDGEDGQPVLSETQPRSDGESRGGQWTRRRLDTIRWQILFVALAGWVNRRQLEVIAYLREENRVLKEHLGGQRLHFTDPQRRRLAATGYRLGRPALTAVATSVTPDTILRWHRQMITRKWTTVRRRVGRPGVCGRFVR